MPTANLPSRLSERSFRVYESDIAFIVNAFPKCVKLTPSEDKNLNTYCARLRDAILSFSRFNWPSTLVNRETFLACEADVFTSQRADHVLAGSRSHVVESIKRSEGAVEATKEQFNIKNQEPWNCGEITNLLVLDTIAHLASQGMLSRPLRYTGDLEHMVQTLEENYDIRIDREADGTFVIQ